MTYILVLFITLANGSVLQEQKTIEGEMARERCEAMASALKWRLSDYGITATHVCKEEGSV